MVSNNGTSNDWKNAIFFKQHTLGKSLFGTNPSRETNHCLYQDLPNHSELRRQSMLLCNKAILSAYEPWLSLTVIWHHRPQWPLTNSDCTVTLPWSPVISCDLSWPPVTFCDLQSEAGYHIKIVDVSLVLLEVAWKTSQRPVHCTVWHLILELDNFCTSRFGCFLCLTILCASRFAILHCLCPKGSRAGVMRSSLVLSYDFHASVMGLEHGD